jgi:hypothetical protein
VENQASPIERLPFFKGFHSEGKAIIDVKILDEWLIKNQGIELLSEEDEEDRKRAYEELKSGKSIDLREAIKKW